MATLTQSSYIIPIGCSCINQLQLNFKYGTSGYDSHLFDFNIVTPDSTIEIFKSKGQPFLNSINDLSLHSSQILSSKKLPGFYWWHMEQFIGKEFYASSVKDFESHIQKFTDKHKYQVKKFFEIEHSNIIFLWSNIQPNLKVACETFFDQFILTSSRYWGMKDAVNKSFKGSRIIFLVRPELVESELFEKNDVLRFDVPFDSRGESAAGDANLYSTVWELIDSYG